MSFCRFFIRIAAVAACGSVACAGEFAVGRGTFSEQRGTYSDPRGTFSNPRGTFSNPRGTFTDPRGTYSERRGTYTEPRHVFTDPRGTSTDPRGTYTEQRGSYTERPGTFSERPTVRGGSMPSVSNNELNARHAPPTIDNIPMPRTDKLKARGGHYVGQYTGDIYYPIGGGRVISGRDGSLARGRPGQVITISP